MTKTRTQIHSKVGGATVAGAASGIFIWLAESKGYSIPGDVRAYITTLFVFAGGYFASS